MKLQAILESAESKALLRTQQILLDSINDPDWSVTLTSEGLHFSHPKLPGAVNFGIAEYTDLDDINDGSTRQDIERAVIAFWESNGLKPTHARCTRLNRNETITTFPNLMMAIDAALIYFSGSAIEDMSDDDAERLAETINDKYFEPAA